MKPIILLSFLLLSITGISQNQPENETCSCCTENHYDFDFWIGEWTVTDEEGNVVGNSVIDKIQENCILRENWSGTKGGYTGTSYNFYNLATKQWEQTWIDNKGANLYLRGNREGNKMVLRSTELKNKDGDPFYHQITWTENEDGTVRQLWEMITNETEITVAFDGRYKKKSVLLRD